MARCNANKHNGTPCERIVSDSQQFCFAHDPSKAAQRSKAASAAARAKNSTSEVIALRDRIKRYMDEVERGKLDKSKASVLGQLAGVAIKAIQAHQKAVEQQQIIAEIEEIKRLEEQRTGRTSGAR